MFKFLYAFNFILVVFSFLFMLRSIYKHFIDEGLPKILLLLLSYILALVGSIKVIELCNIADWEYQRFLVLGYTPALVWKWQAAAVLLFSVYYLYIYLIVLKNKRRIERNTKAAEQKKWSGL